LHERHRYRLILGLMNLVAKWSATSC
jgi:hypothetical protein